MIIDAHTHIGMIAGQERRPDELLRSMDEAGINHSLVITDIGSGPLGTTNGLVEALESYDRLHAVGRVDLATIGQAQFDELLALLRERKIVGIKLYPGYENYDPTDQRLELLLAACEAEGFPIIVHTGILMIGLNGLLKQAHPLLVDEVAHRYPKLTIVMAHFGNPWVMDCAAVVSRNPNVYIDLSGFFHEFKPITDVDAHEFVSTLTMWRGFVGNFKRCLFGTDWPLYSQREYLDATQQLPLTDNERDLVFWQNAQDLFKLPL